MVFEAVHCLAPSVIGGPAPCTPAMVNGLDFSRSSMFFVLFCFCFFFCVWGVFAYLVLSSADGTPPCVSPSGLRPDTASLAPPGRIVCFVPCSPTMVLIPSPRFLHGYHLSRSRTVLVTGLALVKHTPMTFQQEHPPPAQV